MTDADGIELNVFADMRLSSTYRLYNKMKGSVNLPADFQAKSGKKS